MRAILCSRGKGGGCKVVDIPEAPMRERHDLFGRTEQEIEKAIEHGERILEITRAWRGNDSLGAEITERLHRIAVDRRQLQTVRGERVEYDPPLRHMNDAQLEKWRKDIVKLGNAGAR